MTIESPDSVDGLGIDRQNSEVVLLISDHLPWADDDAAHFSLLENKLDAYVNFIRSGQVLEAVPGSEGLPIRIRLVHEYEPTEAAKTVLEAVKQQLAEIGMAFSYLGLPANY